MVSLTEIYNIKESTLDELKSYSSRNPARGNKGKERERDWYLDTLPPDPETGASKSYVRKNISFVNMYKDLEAETQDMQKLSDDHPEDMVLHNLADGLNDVKNKFYQYIKKKQPEAFKKIKSNE